MALKSLNLLDVKNKKNKKKNSELKDSKHPVGLNRTAAS